MQLAAKHVIICQYHRSQACCKHQTTFRHCFKNSRLNSACVKLHPSVAVTETASTKVCINYSYTHCTDILEVTQLYGDLTFLQQPIGFTAREFTNYKQSSRHYPRIADEQEKNDGATVKRRKKHPSKF